MEKKLLIIDNEDLTEIIEEIAEIAKKKNIKISCFPLYVGLPEGNDTVDENGRISTKLVHEKINREYGDIRFHLVASDFDFNEKDAFDGVKMLSLLDSIRNTRKSHRLLYSSLLNDIVQEYLDLYLKNKDFDEVWKKFKILIKLNIIDFVVRDDVEKIIVDSIEKLFSNDNDLIIEELLGKPHLKFNKHLDFFENKTFEEIAQILCSDEALSEKFKKKLFEKSFAFLTDINE